MELKIGQEWGFSQRFQRSNDSGVITRMGNRSMYNGALILKCLNDNEEENYSPTMTVNDDNTPLFTANNPNSVGKFWIFYGYPENCEECGKFCNQICHVKRLRKPFGR